MNKVIEIGRLARDSELRYSPSGTAICNFTIAVDRTFKNAQGEKEADFLPVVAFKPLAELCSQYLSKGKLVAVDGRLQTRNYTHKDGYKVYITEIIANEVQFLSPKDGNSSGASSSSSSSLGHEVNLDDDDSIPF